MKPPGNYKQNKTEIVTPVSTFSMAAEYKVNI